MIKDTVRLKETGTHEMSDCINVYECSGCGYGSTMFDSMSLHPFDAMIFYCPTCGKKIDKIEFLDGETLTLEEWQLMEDTGETVYNEMSKRLDELMDKDEDKSPDERKEMEWIATLLEKYDERVYPYEQG